MPCSRCGHDDTQHYEKIFNCLACLECGRFERDKGIRQVTDHNQSWHDGALKALEKLRGTGKTMTGEQMRFWLAGEVGFPKHPNAWGALINAAVKVGLIQDTGDQSQMTATRSHARRTPVWRFGA